MTTQRHVERGTNPYVGPRALRRRDPLFGRDREARALTDLLIAERIVLLHAPSGAGKTSLIQAGVLPRLEDEKFSVSGPLRLNGVRPDDAAIQNRYLWSAVDGLLGDGHAVGADEVTSLEDALSAIESAKPEADHVIVLDQFEEVLTLDPPDWESQEQFFRELGTALEREDRWALVSMREDYMGGLARYLRHLPSRLDVTFRLDFLERNAAREAMRGPAAKRGVTFTDEAAHLLAADLSAIRVQHPLKGVVTVKGPYVEPVQLQVVCETLWRRLERKLGAGFTAIEEEHIKGYGDLDRALGNFYADVVDEVARATGASERALRDWFGTALITDARFRGQSSTGPAVAGIDVADVLRELEDRYLIRSDERNATRWYELSHDRMVEPVLANNEQWWIRHASRWELRADEWFSAGRDQRHLLRGNEQRYAKQWLREHEGEAGEHVRELIDASKAARASESLRQRVSTAISILSILVVLQTILLIALLLSR